MKAKQIVIWFAAAAIALLFAGCAPNNDMFLAKSAGFWAGLWHGLIVIVTFIISLFTDKVGVYEANNSGSWYDFGFILGILISVGHGKVQHSMQKKWTCKAKKEKEWEEIGKQVEEKVRIGIKNWLDDTENKDREWEEIGKKIEERIKQELRNWTEKP